MTRRTAGLSRAFSLVEVVIALGVVSFSVLAILGLLPVGYKSASDSRRETCAAFIAQQIVGDLRASPFDAAAILCRGTDGRLASLAPFSLAADGAHVLACDAQNNVLRELPSAAYDAPDTDADTAFLVRVRVVASPAGLSQVEVEVSAPPVAAAAARSRFGFATTVGGGA